MKRICANELSQHENNQVMVRGWLNNVRAFGKLTFLLLRDRTGFAQIVIENEIDGKKISAQVVWRNCSVSSSSKE